MNPPFPDRRFLLTSIAIFVLGLGLRVPGLSRPTWLDETHSLTRATDPTLVDLSRHSLVDRQPPLYFVALRTWIAVFGRSDVAARLFSLVLASGSLVLLLATLGARSPLAGLSAALLFATNPLLVRYGTEIRSYGLLIFLVLVAVASAWQITEAPSGRFARIALLIAIPLAVLTHAAGVFLIPALLAFVAVAAARAARKAALLAIAPPIVVAAAVFLALAARLDVAGRHARDWWIPPTTMGIVARCFGSLFGFPGWPAEGHTGQLALGAAILVVAVAFVLASRQRGAIGSLAGAGAFWAPVVLCSFLVFPIVLDRVLLPGLPLFFSALALAASSRPFRQRLAAAAAILVIAVLWTRDVSASFGRPIEDFRGAASRIGREYRPGDTIIVFPDFAANALKRYLPGEAARAVGTRGGETAPRVTLLVRPGLDFRAVGDSLFLRLEAIASRTPRPAIRILLIEPIDAPMSPEAALYRDESVAAAHKALGDPDEESTNGVLYDARWNARSRQ